VSYLDSIASLAFFGFHAQVAAEGNASVGDRKQDSIFATKLHRHQGQRKHWRASL
jgi:hypothetical protein